MGTKYSTNTPTGYNSSPPADDGSTTASNKITWATIKTKLTDCFNTWSSSLNTALLNAFDTSCSSITGTYTTVASDNAKTLQCSGTFTVSLGDASTLGAGWYCHIVNSGSGTITIGRATGGNTLAGAASNITLAPLQATAVIVNQAANGFNIIKGNNLIFDSTDPTKQLRFDPSGITTGNTRVATSPDFNFRMMSQTHGADIASAGTVNLDTATGDLVDVTGTTTITAITLADGKKATVRFTGILTLTNGGSLVLPGGANITTAAGDYAAFRGYSGGVVRCSSYIKADGTPVVNANGTTITLGTEQASTSGTSIDFTGIPTWAKRVTILFGGVSGNGTSNLLIQIGNGSVVTTGYVSGSWNGSTGATTSTAGYVLTVTNAAAALWHGKMTIELENASNNWVASGFLVRSDSGATGNVGAGTKSLAGALDRVRITTVSGADTFDAGVINISYE